jgi:hypothetical protein
MFIGYATILNIVKGIQWKRPKPFCYRPPSPLPLACTGRLHLLDKEKKDYERGKERAVIAGGEGWVGWVGAKYVERKIV